MKEKLKDDYAKQTLEFIASLDSTFTLKDVSRIIGACIRINRLQRHNEKK
jgi:hypothetical protein